MCVGCCILFVPWLCGAIVIVEGGVVMFVGGGEVIVLGAECFFLR